MLKSDTECKALPDADESRYRIYVEDVMGAVALGNYASDFSTIPPYAAEKAIIAEQNVPIIQFETRIELEGAFESDHTVKFFARSVTLSITIVLPGKNIPVHIREIELVVTERAMDEVLLGLLSQKAIGFDLKRLLETVCDDTHDNEITNLESATYKLAASAYKGLAYLAAAQSSYRRLWLSVSARTRRSLSTMSLSRFSLPPRTMGNPIPATYALQRCSRTTATYYASSSARTQRPLWNRS